MKEKDFILAARVVSMVFTPFYLPLVGLIALFVFSYLNQLPTAYKLYVLALVYSFTILLPTFLIRVKERRMVPYVISIACYSAAYYTMNALHIPHFMGSILIAALLIQVFCAFINVGWKVSVHSAAIGGVVGALLAFSLIFGFDPLWWLCLTLFISGVVGSSRMLLRQHSLSQVVVAWLIGFFMAFIVIARF